AERVGRLVEHGGVQVDAAGPADAELIRRVQLDIACPGAGSWLEGAGGRQFVLRLGVGGEADVAEARVALGPAGAAERLPVIGDDADVDGRLDGPGLEGAQDLALPDGGGGNGVQRAKQFTGAAADGGAVRRETEGQVCSVRPRVAPGGGDAAVFELLDGESRTDGRHGKILSCEL